MKKIYVLTSKSVSGCGEIEEQAMVENNCDLYENFDEAYLNFFATIKEKVNRLGILDIFKDKLELQDLYDANDFFASENVSVKEIVEKIDNLESFVFKLLSGEQPTDEFAGIDQNIVDKLEYYYKITADKENNTFALMPEECAWEEGKFPLIATNAAGRFEDDTDYYFRAEFGLEEGPYSKLEVNFYCRSI